MDKQNITLSIPKDVLRKAKILAIENDMSLSSLLTETLITLVDRSEQYNSAKERHVAFLKEGANLQADYSWSRSDLHER